MKSKSTGKKSPVSRGGANEFQQFFLWHGEKILVGIFVVVALLFALKGLGYQTLSWQPDALKDISTAAEEAIRKNTWAAENEGVEIFDYATYAEQMKEPTPAKPYRSESAWLPPLGSSRPSSE